MPGVIEVDLFDKAINGADHPAALQFRDLLQEVAKDFKTSLVFFEVHAGTVSFAFESDELTAEILKVLEEK